MNFRKALECFKDDILIGKVSFRTNILVARRVYEQKLEY